MEKGAQGSSLSTSQGRKPSCSILEFGGGGKTSPLGGAEMAFVPGPLWVPVAYLGASLDTDVFPNLWVPVETNCSNYRCPEGHKQMSSQNPPSPLLTPQSERVVCSTGASE